MTFSAWRPDSGVLRPTATDLLRRRSSTDPFAALMPAELSQMPVAWQQLRIPGPPRALELSRAERTAKSLEIRFSRRTIQRLEFSRNAAPDPRRAKTAEPTDQLALVDKASPHALFDLMLTEVSSVDAGQAHKADASSVMPMTGQALWQTAANFQRFVSSPEIHRELGLTDIARQPGWLQLALNCDPNTDDRESVQALKSFHLHLIYWRASELRALTQASRFLDQQDPYLARQCLDPLSFLGPRLCNDRLADLESEFARLGASLVPADSAATCAGHRPMGCLIQLPSWDLLATFAFERLIRQLHQRLAETATALLRAVTGSEQAPAPWQRHPLLPRRQIAQNLETLGLSSESRTGLLALTQRLHDLTIPVARYLRDASPARRMHCMTLNQPCYSLSLSPMDARGRSTMGVDGPLLLSLQVKLFSGIGGAGLISLPGLPSVRVLRAQGQFSEADWQRRADFQGHFAAYNTAALMAQHDTQLGGPNKQPDQRWNQRPDQRSTGPTNAHRQGPPRAIRQAPAEGHLSCGPLAQFQSATGWTL